jgi:alkanesulfonate monooxygenase SsuD/methylene tetrahydromethanopterin reductase-like flavin-dependent oxidoreductase (luciferase family)
VAGTDQSYAQHARRCQSPAGWRSLAARPGARQAASAWGCAERRVPILLAALAPSSVRLAGELADDWLPFLWARSRLPDGRALLAEGEAAGERSTPTGVAASVPLAIAQDDETARQIAAGWLLAYLTRMGPLYPRMLRDHFGFRREVDALLEANDSGGPPRLPAAAERLARDVTVMGTYEEAPEAIRLWLGGADTVDLVLPLGVPEGQLSDMLEAAAPSDQRGRTGPDRGFVGEGVVTPPGRNAATTGLQRRPANVHA